MLQCTYVEKQDARQEIVENGSSFERRDALISYRLNRSTGKRVSEKCVSDEDCEGPYYQCIEGKCACPSDFEEYSLDEKLKVCRPARDEVGAKCQSNCKPPLLCQNGKCICFKGVVSGNKCTIQCPSGQTLVGQECRKISSNLGGSCQADTDCAIASSYCSSGRCDCIPGSKRSGSYCVLTCPDGSGPTKACRKIMVNDANALANLDKQDTCPRGQGCFTFGKPNIGHCCPLYCPYGSADLSKSCAAGSATGDKCPDQTTHYCQLFEDHGVKNALCCPRPCREPTPLFISGACYPKAHWGDVCKEDAQCEGGVAMQCNGGKCACMSGFNQVNYTWATCQKFCGLQVFIEGQCKSRVGVGDPCLSSAMCPLRSICREGVCQCDCASALSRNMCVNPDDPLGVDSFFKNWGSILGKGDGTRRL